MGDADHRSGDTPAPHGPAPSSPPSGAPTAQSPESAFTGPDPSGRLVSPAPSPGVGPSATPGSRVPVTNPGSDPARVASASRGPDAPGAEAPGPEALSPESAPGAEAPVNATGPVRHPIMALLDSVGGMAALVDSAAPTIVFALTYTLTHRHLRAAVVAAVAVAGLLAIWRLVRRQAVQTVVVGFLGIALAAGIAEFTGRASDYYLLSIIRALGLTLVYAVSALVRWPIVGVVVGAAAGRPGGFRKDPEQLRAYTRVTWFWVGLFLLRLGVRGPLLLANKFGWLSVTDVVMGWPLFAVWVALTYVLLRRWLHGSVWEAAHEGIVGRNARTAARSRERSAARRGTRRPRPHGDER